MRVHYYLIDIETINIKCRIDDKEFDSYYLICNINISLKCYIKHSNHIIKILFTLKIFDITYTLVSRKWRKEKILFIDNYNKKSIMKILEFYLKKIKWKI